METVNKYSKSNNVCGSVFGCSPKSIIMSALGKPQILSFASTPVRYTLFDVKWIPDTAKFVSVGGKPNGTGMIEIYSLLIDKHKIKKISKVDNKNHFKCATFEGSAANATHLATGDLAGRFEVWDLENPLLPIYGSQEHKDTINGIDGIGKRYSSCGAPELVTGSADGSVMVWDVRQKNTPVARFHQRPGRPTRDCWTVAFGNCFNDVSRVVAAGYDNGDIRIYDLRAMSTLYEDNLKNGVVSVQFDRKDIKMNKLVATTLESRIFCYDLRIAHPKRGFARIRETGHDSTVWAVRHLPQNREIFMTTGGSGTLILWNYIYPTKRVDKDADGIEYGIPGELLQLQNTKITEQPITAFDWSPDKTGLSVCSSIDQTLRVSITTRLNLI